eukprot:COSAG02_NODE_1520_length_12166_cov_8.338195_7_plen_52_part_00
MNLDSGTRDSSYTVDVSSLPHSLNGDHVYKSYLNVSQTYCTLLSNSEPNSL